MADLLFLFSQRPHSSIYPQDALDAALAGSAFADIAILFLDAGVLQLLDTKPPYPLSPRKAFQRGFAAFSDYDIHGVYCCETAFRQFQLEDKSLIIQPTLVTRSEIKTHLASAKQVLSF